MDSDSSAESDAEISEVRGGRARSNSITKRDTIVANANAGIPIVPSPSETNPTYSPERAETKERSNLTERELKALRKGLDEATHHRDRESIREEEEEKRAADAEKKIRSAVVLPSKIGIEPPMRKFKILMLGDSGVGKSSLINRWTADTFTATLVGTVGVDFKAKKVQHGTEHLNIQVWDTAGQEQFHKITTSYYRGANGIMLVYDISDRSSYNNVEYWIKNIKQHANEFVHVALIGNKIDLRVADSGAIEFEEGSSLAAKFGVPYFETSAKDATNVESAFQTVVSSIVDSDKRKEGASSPKRTSVKTIAEKAEMHKNAGMKPDEKCLIS
jgi:small GTP-binding protein